MTFNPFSEDPTLRNIFTGVVANDDVNVHLYETVGMPIVQSMQGRPIFQISFKRKDKVKTLGDVDKIKVTQDKSIDPALFFQRALVVSKTGVLSPEEVIKYELSLYPATLFEAPYLLRKS